MPLWIKTMDIHVVQGFHHVALHWGGLTLSHGDGEHRAYRRSHELA